jgi:putative FmdB family regulatory protein
VPLYEYQCTSCAAVTDVRHGFNETTNEACPACGGVLKRLFNPAGIVFKGSGFYVTDSRKAETSATKTDAAKPDAPKAEAKPAAPAGPKSDAAA